MKQRLKDRINRRNIYKRLCDETKSETLPERKFLLSVTVAALIVVPMFALSIIYAFGNQPNSPKGQTKGQAQNALAR